LNLFECAVIAEGVCWKLLKIIIGSLSRNPFTPVFYVEAA
jgi:hypothetical protein